MARAVGACVGVARADGSAPRLPPWYRAAARGRFGRSASEFGRGLVGSDLGRASRRGVAWYCGRHAQVFLCFRVAFGLAFDVCESFWYGRCDGEPVARLPGQQI